ncbi:acyl-CoA/acyl-ACP dehydrogenase [Catenulispora sp. NL8]|uniref:Acyl-CoA/acyl-ACP dehydrogenase n=1 Tax=Catenulispora pinistramenti TaxID=2705254 RepID=A0ABS5KS89_9ACTN|nr:acyl-CoA dehydrogenase family protein [Catenulispora pinistramenti]MBS2548906.1 acyl-CoA/acyl-ACP dehydrogenase [Catenulispora pinistramenti]
MDLDFSEEQILLRDTVRDLCAKHVPLDTVRALENDPERYPEDFWKQAAQLGLHGMRLPEEHGGTDMTLLDAALVYAEFGRALVPSPHFASTVLAGQVIAAAGSAEQRERWLPRIASGAGVFTVAWLEPERSCGPKGVRARAVPAEGGGYRLSGAKRHVPYARGAERVLVLAREEGSGDEGPGDIAFLLVDPAAEGVRLTQQLTVASDTQYRMDFQDVPVAQDSVIRGGWSVWDAVLHDAIVLAAAQSCGAARRTLEFTVDYALTRHQFDKPLGAFQAIAHYLSDAVTAIDGAETLVWEAAWARDAGRSTAKLAPMAKLFAGDTFRDVTATAQQIFGGNGFTVEFDTQLYFRRAKQWQMAWWDARYLEELIAVEVLDAA